jgi:type II secretory pathway component PulF
MVGFGRADYTATMFFSPRIALRPLIGLCRRMSTALSAGIDLRTVLAREAERTTGPLHHHLLLVGEEIARGESLADALASTAEFFPPLFRELIALGEHTGHLDAVLGRLAEHYQHQLDMRRVFLASILWPMVQLAIAAVVVGGLIWFMGTLPRQPGNPPIDLLGFGLVGNRGLAVYLTFLACAGGAFWLIKRAVGRGLVWTKPIQRIVLRLPGIGGALRTLAISRLAWSMHVTLDAGMDVRQALRLSLRSTRNARYTDQIPLIDAHLMAGHSIHEAFSSAGGYPADFLDTLAVGEQSGRVVESMATLARLYQDQARAALTILAMFAGWAVWAAVAAIIIVLIFRLFSFYLSALGV